MKQVFLNATSALTHKAVSLCHNRKGVAAIEFAFVAPIMIAFYFGLAETTLAITKDRNVAHTASVVGDLATQVSELDKSDVEDIMTAALAVVNLSPSERNDVTIELNSFVMRSDGSKIIDRIGYARLGPKISKGETTFSPGKLSKNMLNETSGAVVARVNFKYKPETLIFVKNMTLAETFVLKPRKSLSVPFDEGGKNSFLCNVTPDLKAKCS